MDLTTLVLIYFHCVLQTTKHLTNHACQRHFGTASYTWLELRLELILMIFSFSKGVNISRTVHARGVLPDKSISSPSPWLSRTACCYAHKQYTYIVKTFSCSLFLLTLHYSTLNSPKLLMGQLLALVILTRNLAGPRSFRVKAGMLKRTSETITRDHNFCFCLFCPRACLLLLGFTCGVFFLHWSPESVGDLGVEPLLNGETFVALTVFFFFPPAPFWESVEKSTLLYFLLQSGTRIALWLVSEMFTLCIFAPNSKISK